MPSADPTGFLQALGGLHDVRLDAIKVDTDAQTMALSLADVNASFAGLPDDPGRRPGVLLLHGVQSVMLASTLEEGIRISAAVASGSGSIFRLSITFNIGGVSHSDEHLAVTFASMAFQPQTTWYAASIVIALLTTNAPDAPVGFYENVVLIEAESAPAALAEARRLGSEAAAIDDDMTIDGVKASTVFAGVRKLVTISNPPDQHPDGAPPLSGTELSYSFFTARDQASFERYLAGHEVELVYEE